MKFITAIFLLMFSLHSEARWLDVSGKVLYLVTYANTNTILVTLDQQGSDVSECSSKDTFAISRGLDPEARSRMYSLLLAAKVSDTPVVISFNEVGNCESWSSTQNVYRKITRLR